jgi:integrase
LIYLDYIQQHLEPYKHKKNTYRNKKIWLDLYFKIIKANPENYFDANRNYPNDVRLFVNTINNPSHKNKEGRQYAPLTKKQALAHIRYFIEGNFTLYDLGKIFPKNFWKRQLGLIKGSKPLTIDRKPTIDELKKLLNHANILYKAIFFTSATSGQRIESILKLEIDDIDFDYEPVKLTIYPDASKSGNPIITFITPECSDVIKQWLNVRDSRLKTMINRSIERIKTMEKNRKRNPIEEKKDETTKLLFPVKYATVQQAFMRLLNKAGLDKRNVRTTNRYELHIHSLRKFFISQLKQVPEIPESVIHILAGQEGYMGGSYDRFDADDLAGHYKKGIHKLNIYEGVPKEELTQIKEEIRKEMKTKMDEKFKAQGEYIRIISDIQQEKIKLTEHEKELIEDWGLPVLSATDEDWEYYSKNGTEEAFETNTILERLRKKRRKRQ